MAQRPAIESVTAAASSTAPGERPKVLYVMGAGRSGSTILGVTLGNCAGVFFAGELDKWLLMSAVPLRERASGASDDGGRASRLWGEVRDDLDGASALFGRQARHCLEHSSSLLRVDRWPARRRLRGRYRRVNEALYRSIAARTGAAQIVDSSHLPLRARELQSLDGIAFYLLFLVRNPHGVVASWGRPGLPEPRFSMLATNAYLWLTHVLSVYVFLRQPRERRLLVRYEDFLARPEAVVGEILELIGSEAATPELGALDTGAPYHGNRLVLRDVVALERRPAAPPRRSRVTALLQLPWAVLLGRLRPSCAPPPATSPKPKVVYVMGAGKSGSTILGVTLGNCADFFYAGELDKWLITYGVPAVGGAERTRFWNRVQREVDGAAELYGGRAQQCLERVSALLRPDRWPAARRLVAEYRRVTESLYHAIANTAQASYVVDSSHLPLRAHQLQQIAGIELYLIFLTRDRRSIVASHVRHVKRHEVAERRLLSIRTNVNMWLTYLLSTLVFLRQRRERRLLLRYEEFAADPEGVLRDVLDRVGSTAEIPDLASLSVGMPLQGNRLIRSDSVAFKRQAPPPHRSSRLARLVGGR